MSAARDFIDDIAFLTLRGRLPPEIVEIKEVARGDVDVSAQVALYSVVGASVAVCLMDANSGWVGMCHVMLPAQFGRRRDDAMLKADSILETLNNSLCEAIRSSGNQPAIKSKIFGAVESPDQNELGFSDGKQSLIFSRTWLRTRNIPILAEAVGGNKRREIVLVPGSGRVFCKQVSLSSDFLDKEREGLLVEAPPLNKVELF